MKLYSVRTGVIVLALASHPVISVAEASYCDEKPSSCAQVSDPKGRKAIEDFVTHLDHQLLLEFGSSIHPFARLTQKQEARLIRNLAGAILLAGDTETRAALLARWFARMISEIAARHPQDFGSRYGAFRGTLLTMSEAEWKSLAELALPTKDEEGHFISFTELAAQLASSPQEFLTHLRALDSVRSFHWNEYFASLHLPELADILRRSEGKSLTEIEAIYRSGHGEYLKSRSQNRLVAPTPDELYRDRLVPRAAGQAYGASAMYLGQAGDAGKDVFLEYKPKIGRAVRVGGTIIGFDHVSVRIRTSEGAELSVNSNEVQIRHFLVQESPSEFQISFPSPQDHLQHIKDFFRSNFLMSGSLCEFLLRS